MNNSFFLSLFLISLASCKNEIKPVSQDEAYELLNEVILDDSLQLKQIHQSFADVALNDKIRKLFIEEEFQFISNQQENCSQQVEQNKIIYFHRGYKKGDFATIKNDVNDCTQISFPLITPDRKSLLIHIQNYFGMLSSSSGDYLYRKKNGKWELEEIFNQIIS